MRGFWSGRRLQREDLGAVGSEAFLVAACGVVGEVCPGVLACPEHLVARGGKLLEREEVEGAAVCLEPQRAVRCKDAAVLHEAGGIRKTTACLTLAGERRGEVEVDARELAGGEGLGHAVPVPGEKDNVLEAALCGEATGVGHAERLAVHAEEEHVRLATSGLHREGALAAAQVKADLAKAPGARRSACCGGAAQGVAGLRPAARIVLWCRLDEVRVALEALLEDKVLGCACVHGASTILCSSRCWMRTLAARWMQRSRFSRRRA